MDNKNIAAVLKKISVFKELKGENPFKIRAFAQAARVLERINVNVEELCRQNRLQEIKGIGKQIASVIEEILRTGKSSVLKELKDSFPESIEGLLKIPGMGPKKARVIWEKLGIASLGELEYACLENRLAALEGFGQKSQKKILSAIDFIRKNSEMHLLPEAEDIACGVMASLKSKGLFKRIEVTGSLRRGKTTFKSIDILLMPEEGTGKDTSLIEETAASLADTGSGRGEVFEFSNKNGSAKVSIKRQGLQVDFRMADEISYTAALRYFTGSRKHNAVLKKFAENSGFEINENGIFNDGKRINIKTEAEIYKTLGLAWIPPELREGSEEVEAAAKGEIPPLVLDSDIKGMIHVHSAYSDGSCSIKELAEACISGGYLYLCLSDHSQSAFYAGGLSESEIMLQLDEVKTLNREFAPFKIFCGIESDILPNGNLDYSDEILGRLDFVIGSIHSGLNMTEEEATNRLVSAIRNPYLTVLGHISGRLLLSRRGYPYNEGKILDELAANKTVLEHNCNPHRLDPGWELLKKAGERSIMISIDTDAHSIEGFSDVKYGVKMAGKAWLRSNAILNAMDAEEIDEFFRKRKKGKGIKSI